jgi:hypothetical protein
MKTICVVTDITAPVEFVWAELTAISKYATWNPFITMFRGDLVQGSRLEIRIEPPGGRAMTFRPTITEVVDEIRLEWLGRLLVPGLFDGRHSFDLTAVGGSETRLTQVEEFSGILVPLMGTILERTRAGFEAMNDALRVRAERAAATSSGL